MPVKKIKLTGSGFAGEVAYRVDGALVGSADAVLARNEDADTEDRPGGLYCTCGDSRGGACEHIFAVQDYQNRLAERMIRRAMRKPTPVDFDLPDIGEPMHFPADYLPLENLKTAPHFDALELDMATEFMFPPTENTGPDYSQWLCPALKAEIARLGMGGRWLQRASKTMMLECLKTGRIPGKVINLTQKVA